MITYLIAVPVIARIFNRQIIDGLWLRFENIKLIEDLRQQKDRADQANRTRAVFDRYGSLRGFPSGVISDSESVLVKEAGMDGSTFIVGFALTAFGGD